MKGLSLFLFLAVSAAYAQVNECPPEQESNWAIESLLRHEDCNKFYKCTFGQPVEYSCYGNLYFNLETWQCDWPENVDCEGRNEPEPTTLAPSTASTTSTTLAPTTPTTTTTTTTTTPAPTTTTTTTTPAPTTTTTTTTTPAPTTTTTTTTTTPAPTTTTTTTTTPAPTTTTTTLAPTTSPAPECEVEIDPPTSPRPDGEEKEEEEEIEFLPNGCPVDPTIHWLLPHAEDCNLFYYCVWGELVLRQCSPTLYFNPVLQVCDWPHDAGCTVSANKHAIARRQLLNQILSK